MTIYHHAKKRYRTTIGGFQHPEDKMHGTKITTVDTETSTDEMAVMEAEEMNMEAGVAVVAKEAEVETDTTATSKTMSKI